MILAGDIGGTKTVLALYDESPGGLKLVRQQVFSSKAYPSFTGVLEDFLRESPDARIRVAAFGVAGPVVDGRVRTTNLPWVLDEQELAQMLGAKRVRLLNDLESAANGMPYLTTEELYVLNPGVPRSGHAGLVSAGTGLGVALLFWDGSRYHPIASEGGHVDFAPQSDVEIELFKYLRSRFGHVSYERILSGPGLRNVYEFLRDTGVAEEPPWLHDKIAAEGSAAISELALANGHPLCVEALSLFVRIYGAAAGNLALTILAYGGMYIGGGIAPKIMPKLTDGTFMQGFTAKGRYEQLLRDIPVRVALNPAAPLIGAAQYACRL